MELSKLSGKELVDKLNGLEVALHYNEVRGYESSVSEINDKIYEIQQELKNRR